jgi:hypothetical protein
MPLTGRVLDNAHSHRDRAAKALRRGHSEAKSRFDLSWADSFAPKPVNALHQSGRG